MTRRVVLVLLLSAAVLLLSAPRQAASPSGSRAGVDASASSGGPPAGAPNGAQPSARDSAGSAGGEAVRLGIPVPSDTSGAPLTTRPAPVEEAGVPTAGLGDPSPGSANQKVQAAMGSGLDPTTGSGGTSPLPSFPATPNKLPATPNSGSCPSPCAVDTSVWDHATPEPVLRPLASDCRLPCYGTSRVGPASWYNAGSGYYAAIPGYLGGVVSVVVCTFPNGQANCHTFPVTTSCQCYRHEKRERVVDLSPAAFSLFAPLSKGLVMVQVTVLGGGK